MTDTAKRFLRYVQIDTTSEEGHETTPSTACQFDLARLLVEELKELGAQDVYLDEQLCYVYAAIPSNIDKAVPRLGFVAHMDTSPAVTGKNVKPIITENYDGSDIVMGTSGRVLSAKEYPSLLNYIGQTIICTDGNTLLGADDKAGVAEIMGFVQYCKEHPEYKHGDIKIAFTPDEEVGMGTFGFDIERFGADFAYTVDGGPVGGIDYECFNAAGAMVTINGTSIHPGSAKGFMKNANRLAMEFDALLPRAESPEYTEGYEGFYHLDTMSATCDSAKMSYIIRDHDAAKFDARKKLFTEAVAFMNAKHGEGTVELELSDTYRNMREIVEQHPHLIENAKRAYTELGIKWYTEPVRGGTDGASLCRRGLPCPNLATGGHNCHGRYEYCAAESLDTMVEVLVKVAAIYAE